MAAPAPNIVSLNKADGSSVGLGDIAQKSAANLNATLQYALDVAASLDATAAAIRQEVATAIAGVNSTVATNSAAISANTTAIAANTTAINLKAPLASPALTGNPTAPTQLQTDNSTRLASTAYVRAAITAIQTQINTINTRLTNAGIA